MNLLIPPLPPQPNDVFHSEIRQALRFTWTH